MYTSKWCNSWNSTNSYGVLLGFMCWSVHDTNGTLNGGYWHLLLPSKTSRKVCDESWCPQLGKLPCKNINYWYKTYSDIALFSTDERKSKDFLIDETLLHVCSTDKEREKGMIINEISTEESESEWVHKSINKEKDANNEAEYEKPSVTYDPVFN